MEQRFFQSVQQMKQRGLKRELHTLMTGNETVVQIGKDKLLLFSSNNYLGLATDKRLKKKAITAIETYGVGAGGARLTTGNYQIHEQLERAIATWQKCESALVFSSGYLANQGAISSFTQVGDVIFSDSLNHASIIDGCRLSKAETIIYQHVDMLDLETKLNLWKGKGKKLIVTDGVFSMDGTIAPLPKIVELAAKYDAYILVDDAHGSGVLGENGEGVVGHYKLQGKVDFIVGTLSKAVGAEGGFVAGSKRTIDFLQNFSRTFIFQTALSPATTAAAMEGIRIIQEEKSRRKKLTENVESFTRELSKVGFKVTSKQTAIISLEIGDSQLANAFSQKLYATGIYIPAIRPPTVPINTSRLRITLMATHSQEQLIYLKDSLIEIAQELGILIKK